MKSYILARVEKPDRAASALDAALPGHRNPWVLVAPAGDAIAYFYIQEDGDVGVDISGRHYFEDAAVLAVLRDVQRLTGGVIVDDNEREVPLQK